MCPGAVSPPGQNRSHYAGDIFRCIFVNDFFLFWCKFHRSLFLRVELRMSQHWFKWWLGAEQAPEPMLTQFINAYMWHYRVNISSFFLLTHKHQMINITHCAPLFRNIIQVRYFGKFHTSLQTMKGTFHHTTRIHLYSGVNYVGERELLWCHICLHGQRRR